MTGTILAAAAVTAAAVATYAARGPIRRLYAPPHGAWRLGATYAIAAALTIAGVSFGHERAIAGLSLFLAGPALALVATILRRDAVNRAHGRHPAWEALPARPGPGRRIYYALLAAGCVACAAALVSIDGWRATGAAWLFGTMAVLLVGAAVTGRISDRLRYRLGASELVEDDEAEPQRDRARR